MDKILLVHLSYDPVPQFIPRVPQARAVGENGTVKRICLAPSIEDAINSKPGHAAMVFAAMHYELPLALYVYKTVVSVAEVIFPKELEKKYGVKDAVLNHEHWILAPPKFLEEIWILDGAIPETRFFNSVPRVEKVDAHRVGEVPPYCIQTVLSRMNKEKGLNVRTAAFLNTLRDLDILCTNENLPPFSEALRKYVKARLPKLIT